MCFTYVNKAVYCQVVHGCPTPLQIRVNKTYWAYSSNGAMMLYAIDCKAVAIRIA